MNGYYYECRECEKEFTLLDGDREVCPHCGSPNVGPVEEPEVQP